MKYAIYPELQGTISASSEDGAYPATNLSNNYRRKVYKAIAGTNSATLTVPISAGSSGIALFETNATSATISITGVGLSTSWTIADGRYWQPYTAYGSSHTATIVLTAPSGTTLEAGIVRAGTIVEMKGLKYSATETLNDFSIKTKLRNGAYYTKKLEMARTFSYSCDMVRETDFRELMTIYKYYGPDPFAMLLTDDTDNDNKWAVFGSFGSVPSASHVYPSDSTVSIKIEEAV